jgi:RNA polymerase primary sigma factor
LRRRNSYFGDFIEDDSAESPVKSANAQMLKDNQSTDFDTTLTYRNGEIIKLR